MVITGASHVPDQGSSPCTGRSFSLLDRSEGEGFLSNAQLSHHTLPFTGEGDLPKIEVTSNFRSDNSAR